MFTKSVSEPWFSLIKSGAKVVEGRLDKGDFHEMKVGDKVKWVNVLKGHAINGKHSFLTKIVGINKYKSFEEYLRTERLKNCLPNVKRIKDGVAIYYQYYSKEDEQKYGVLAIQLELI